MTERRPEVSVSTKEGRNAPKGITTDWSRNIVSELTVDERRSNEVRQTNVLPRWVETVSTNEMSRKWMFNPTG